MLVVGAARGAEAGEQLAFDRGDVRRLQSDGGAEVVMRLRVAGLAATRPSEIWMALVTAAVNSATSSGGGLLRSTRGRLNDPR